MNLIPDPAEEGTSTPNPEPTPIPDGGDWWDDSNLGGTKRNVPPPEPQKTELFTRESS